MFDPISIIVAIASPPGRSLRGIIRLSGAGSLDLLREVCDASTGVPVQRGAATIRLTLNGRSLPAIALIMPGPHSYTGEDSAELQLPGNPVLPEQAVDALLDAAVKLGVDARRAEPGEVTARAFLNGRMSLTQAEGVAATIAAQSDAELRAAHLLTAGSLGDLAHRLADDLAAALALVEAGIDFTDQEDVVAISPIDLYDRLVDVRRRINDHLSRAVGSERLEAIPWVVFVGEPNAGKSALFNALLGHERAVVSPISGTTRDVLTEPLSVVSPDSGGRFREGGEVMLVDLAGLDESADSMNQLMQSAARHAIDRAELILRCVPIDEESPPHVRANEILVRTKADLLPSPLGSGAGGEGFMVNDSQPALTPTLSQREAEQVAVSAVTGAGLDDLKAMIARRLADRAVSLSADALALRPRHESALRSAAVNLGEAIALIEPQKTVRSLAHPELIASAMRAALDDLAALAGDITPDEVLGRVFATFCVGK